MKKMLIAAFVVLTLGILLLSGCRPPEVEGVVVNVQHGLYDKAFDLAQDAVKKYPDNAEAWYWLGYLYGRKDEFVKMNDAYDKSLAIGPQFQSEIEQSRFSYFAKNYNDALKNYFQKARNVEDPAQKQKLYAKAADLFLKSFQAMPSKTEPLTPMSISYLEIGDTTQAESYLDKAVELKPKDDTLMVTVADFYLRIKENQKALGLYERAVQVDSNNLNAHLGLGELYSDQQNWDKAIAEFKTSMRLDPTNANIPFNVAIFYYNNAKYTDAIPYLKKSIELDPQLKKAYDVLSLSYLQEAQEAINKYNDEEKEEYKKQYEAIFDTALPMLEDAVKKFPDDATLWRNLGVIYGQKGMKEKAEQAFDKEKQLEGSGSDTQ